MAVPETAISGDEIVRLEDAYKIYHMGRQEVRALNGVTISFERSSFWAEWNTILRNNRRF